MEEDRIILAEGDGRRADVLLSEKSGLTRSRVAALMEEGMCRVNGAECRKAGTRLSAGSLAELTVPAPRPAVPQAEDLPLEILYEDEDLAVVNTCSVTAAAASSASATAATTGILTNTVRVTPSTTIRMLRLLPKTLSTT